MKKILIVLLLLVFVSSCQKEKISTDFIDSEKSYLLAYGIDDNTYIFDIRPIDLIDTINNNKSAVFFIGNNDCEHCLYALRLLNEVANELEVSVYFIDTNNIYYPFNEYRKEIEEFLRDTLIDNDLYVPLVFSVNDGKLFKYHLGLLSDDYSSEDDKKIKEEYIKILKDYSK